MKKETKARLHKHSEIIKFLEAYSMFLEDQGYTDVDWRAEPPYAIDEFFKSKFYKELTGNDCVSELGHHWLPSACAPAFKDVCLFCGKFKDKKL